MAESHPPIESKHVPMFGHSIFLLLVWWWKKLVHDEFKTTLTKMSLIYLLSHQLWSLLCDHLIIDNMVDFKSSFEGAESKFHYKTSEEQHFWTGFFHCGVFVVKVSFDLSKTWILIWSMS